MQRYYTPRSIAKLMVQLVASSPETAVDICVGSWNLLSEAKKRWQNIVLHGVDIDSKSKKLANHSSFICMDGREFALDCLKKDVKFSLVLANPPFGKDVKEHIKLYNALPGYSQMISVALLRIETTMLLANLSLLKEKGIMVAIVPRTVIDGEWSMCLRKFITKNYQLRSIVNLPLRIFGNEVHTSFLVVENSKTTRITNVYNASLINSKYQLCFKHYLDNQLVVDGYWKPCVPKYPQEDFIHIKRGSISNDILKNTGNKPVVHSTDIINIRNGHWKPTKFMPSNLENMTMNSLELGDIVVIRVGRNSGLAARIDFESEIPASNCLLIINANRNKYQDRIWKFINSKDYYIHLPELRRGVGAKYITSCSLKNYLEAHII